MLTRQRKWLLKLFEQVRDLQASPLERRLLALEIQEQLLRRIGRAEHLIRQIRKANKALKVSLARPGNPKGVAGEIKTKHAAAIGRIEDQQTLISILRSIGDSIAFIYGDRWDLKQMVQKEDSGFLTGKRGARLERGILRKAFEIGATVVLNDLTHTMRHGDIAVFRPDLWPGGGSPFFLVEAKSGRGGDAARAARQMAATNEIFNYLSTDRKEAENGLWHRISVNQEPQYHFEKASRMMSDLPRGGWLIEEVEPGLHYVIIDCSISVPKVRIFGKNAVERGQQCIGIAFTLRFLHGIAEHPLGLSRRKLREGLDAHFFRLRHARNKNRLGVRFRDTALRVLQRMWPVSVYENRRNRD